MPFTTSPKQAKSSANAPATSQRWSGRSFDDANFDEAIQPNLGTQFNRANQFGHSLSGTQAPLQRQTAPEEKDKEIQAKPQLQREALPEEEDEELQMKPQLQRKTMFEEEDELQTRAIQPKLTIGQPGDKYEQEADSMAAKVMAMPDSAVQREAIPEEDQELHAKPQLQWEAMPEEEDETLQAKSKIQNPKSKIQAKGEAPAVPANFDRQLAQHKGSGHPLSDETRAFMEPRFGADFSNVRVHETPDLANAIQAQAFTHGQNIYFNSGKYNPGSSGGKELLAHELTHVVQQRSFSKSSGMLAQRGSNSIQLQKVSNKDNQLSATSKLPKPLPHKIGKVDYYRARNTDYLRRHRVTPPPDYYLDYGDKYASRFTKVLRPKLSKQGQIWVDKTFILLQQAIEKKLAKDRISFDFLEQNAAKFRDFAYDTHPKAYLDGGLDELPAWDLVKILATPDLGDILSISGIKQVIITGVGLMGSWLDLDAKKTNRKSNYIKGLSGTFGGAGASKRY